MRKAVTYVFMISCSAAGLAGVALPYAIFFLFAPQGFQDVMVGLPAILLWPLNLIIIVVFGIAGATAYYLVGRPVLMFLRLWDSEIGQGHRG